MSDRPARLPASRQDGTHPRPQLMRPAFVLLDRDAGFALDPDDVGRSQHWERSPAAFAQTIRLPFSPESPASGIGDTGMHTVVWYRLLVTSRDLDEAGFGTQGDRLLLHLGAVDHTADVWVNGVHVAHHEGGQTAFHADITAALAAADGDHVVVVRAEDDPEDPALPRGKQDWLPEPHVIWYERITGIWRSLWLEAVPSVAIARLDWLAAAGAATVRADIELSRRPAGLARVRVELEFGGEWLGAAEVSTAGTRVGVHVPIAAQRNGQAADALFWSPEAPRLIDARVTVATAGGEVADEVDSYLGIRSVDTAGGRFRLNGRPLVVRAALEQGYWPDTHYTPPGSDAMRAEVALIKQLGFNAARVHQKVEDHRFVYWADRAGLLLWGEIAATVEFSPTAVERLTSDWVDTVRAYRSHPSIVTWVPFNESWGIQHVASDAAQASFSAGLTALTRSLDPTRPVVSNDGWEHTESDLLTVHDYESDGDRLAARYADADSIRELLRGAGPAGRLLVVPGAAQAQDVPLLLTEFGGVAYVPGSDVDGAWGYSSASGADEFAQRIGALFGAATGSAVLAGFCWTQLTDTRQEVNGLCDAHRVPKLAAEEIAAMVRGAVAS